MLQLSKLRISPANSPISPSSSTSISPRWLDEEDQHDFFSEPEELEEQFSEKSSFCVSTLSTPQPPSRRDKKWLAALRETTSDLRAIFAAKNIGVPVDRMGLCLRPSDSTTDDCSQDNFSVYPDFDSACDEFAILACQPVTARLCWSDETWLKETSALIHRLLVILAQKQIGMTVNAFLDFVSINNSNKSSYDRVLSGHLDKVRNRLLCRRESPDLIPYEVFLGRMPLGGWRY